MSVFVVLGLLWAAVILPPILRARAERRAEFIDSFQQQMGALAKKSGAGRAANVDPMLATRRSRRPANLLARPTNPTQRRRDILGGLLGAMIGAFVLGLIPSLRSVWILLLFLVNLFLAYVALLAHNRRHVARRARLERREAVLSPALDTSR